VQYKIYALALPFDLRCESGTYIYIYIYKCKENLLQSIGIITIRSSETRAVIYTCRYPGGQFNP